jgi:predicted secreted protein
MEVAKMVDSDNSRRERAYAPGMTLPRRAALGVAGVAAGTLLVALPVSATPASTTSSAQPRTFHQAASGRTVHVERGEVLRISLRTDSDGGYRWAVVRGRHSSVFRIVSREVVPASTTLVGAPSRTVWTLRAIARGTATFKAVERRPWDRSDVAKRFTLRLRVTRAG